MNVPAVVASVATLAVALVARRRGWGWAAPMIIYSVAWTAMIALYESRLFPFYPLSWTTWLAVAAAACSFVVACFVGGGLAAAGRNPGPASGDSAKVAWAMRTYFAIGLAGAAWFLHQVGRVFGFGAFLSDPMSVHNALSDRTIGSSHLFLYYLGVAGTMLFGYQLIVVRRRMPVVDWVLLAMFVLVMALSTERNHLLWSIACWVFLLVAPPRGDATLRRALAPALALAAAGTLFYLAAGSWLGKSPDNLSGALVIEAALADPRTDPVTAARLRGPGYVPDPASDLPPDSRLRSLLPGGALHKVSVLYMALGAALPALDQGVQAHPRTHGRLTFRPIARLLSRLGLARETLGGTTYDEVRTPYPANAYTYLYEHYRDFGLAGAVVFPALFGFLAGWLYQRLAREPGSYWAVWLASIQGMIVWSPFQNRFVLTVSAYLVVALLVAQLVSHRSAGRLRAGQAAGGDQPTPGIR